MPRCGETHTHTHTFFLDFSGRVVLKRFRSCQCVDTRRGGADDDHETVAIIHASTEEPKSNLVYLTADSSNIITTLDPSKVFAHGKAKSELVH